MDEPSVTTRAEGITDSHRLGTLRRPSLSHHLLEAGVAGPLPLRSSARCDSLRVIFPQVADGYYRSLFLQELKYMQIQGHLINISKCDG